MTMLCVSKKETGFTLMEVLVVVSIIAILSTMGLLNYHRVIDNGKRGGTLDEVREYAMAEGIARGDTGVFWKLQDLQSSSMPTTDVYNRPINSGSNSFIIDSTLWKGPYLNLQKTSGTDLNSKFDAQGNPYDVYGGPYKIALLSVVGGVTTLLDNPNLSPKTKPDFGLVISWGKDKNPGNVNANDGISLSQKSTNYWLYYNEQGSDDVYYTF